jgi:hypothetical protein
MKDISGLIDSIKSGENELADLHLSQILRDRIAVSVDVKKIEIADKIFNGEEDAS